MESWCPAWAERIGPLSSTHVTQLFTARRQESFPGDGNHDLHKITHSAESERFGRYGLSLSSISLGDTVSHVGIFDTALLNVAPLPFSLVYSLPPSPPLPCILYHMGFWASDRKTRAAKSLYRSICLDDDILHCLL
jgi:hypothetical protein